MEEMENTNPQVTPDAITMKYAEAVRLYASTEMTGKQIARQCGLSLPAFRIYLRRHHRSLMLKRNGLEVNADATSGIKLRKKSGQTPTAYKKYKQAIEACDNLAYIQYNVSQIARQFGLDGTALGNQLKLHYPEIIERREKARARLGLNDNFSRGAKPESVEIYAKAVDMLRSTDKNLPTIAEECGVSLAGLSQYLRFYHKDLVNRKNRRQESAAGNRQWGEMSGNNRLTEPSPKTQEKYTEALKLYRETSLTVREIVDRTGVPFEGFRCYLRKWHRDLMLVRRGGEPGADCDRCGLDLSGSKRYLKSTAAKYAPAIDSLREHLRPIAHVAAELGLNPESLRQYLHTHEPELVVAIKTAGQREKSND
ncbi:hypothetical protein [Parabacteroides sp.]|uniref:hypothetical protein n=1 Tax=Parabacteroides sp. TaxID=1869337 RepID=UPI00257B8762|nr:hypothetical protein [Parabacteroides sp.]